MKKNAALLLIILFAKLSVGQNDSLRRNSIFVELGGTGGYFAVGYDRDILVKKNWGLTVGAGLSLMKDHFSNVILFPTQFKTNYKISRHRLELGLGLTPYYYRESFVYEPYKTDGVNWVLFGILGYKYSFFNNRYYVGIAFTPPIVDYHPNYYLWGAVRVEYKF